jgi:hypothetical protein
MKRSYDDKPHPNECPTCQGVGISPASAPRAGQLGSGCETCLGIGRVEHKPNGRLS